MLLSVNFLFTDRLDSVQQLTDAGKSLPIIADCVISRFECFCAVSYTVLCYLLVEILFIHGLW